MNERIEALAKQARYKYPDAVGLCEDYAYFDHEKFAELIVRECVQVAIEQKNWVEDQEVFNPVDEQWNRARIRQSQRIVDKIKQYFGVEE